MYEFLYDQIDFFLLNSFFIYQISPTKIKLCESVISGLFSADFY